MPSNLADLVNLFSSGLCAAATWNGSYLPSYQVALAQAGRRLICGVHLPTIDQVGANSKEYLAGHFDLSSSQLAWLNAAGLPLDLQVDNIDDTFAAAAYRQPLVPANMPASPVTWFLNPAKAGAIDDMALVDPECPASLWASVGAQWASCLTMTGLAKLVPNPAWAGMIENNEGKRWRYLRAIIANGSLLNAQGNPTLSWPAAMNSISLQVAAWQVANPGGTPEQYILQFWPKLSAQFRALYGAFDAGLPGGWQGKLRTAAYQSVPLDYLYGTRTIKTPLPGLPPVPETLYRDAISNQIYNAANGLWDFTSPAQGAAIQALLPIWADAESRNPKAWRELSIHCSARATYLGAQAGRHQVITPALYNAWCHWALWSMRTPGRASILRHWSSSNEVPSTPIMQPADVAALTALGHPELVSAQSDTYFLPAIDACDSILSSATARAFWQTGSPLGPLAVDVNVPTKISVWATGATIGNQTLLYVWSPCAATQPQVTVALPAGAVTVPWPSPSDYYLVTPPSGLQVTKVSV